MSAFIHTPTPSGQPAEPRSQRGTPVWELAKFYPHQGEWTEAQYLALETNHLVEFHDGELEFLPLPTKTHQRLVKFLSRLLDDFVQGRKLGEVLFAPYRVRTTPGKFLEPDILFLAPQRAQHERFSEGADLVIEILSSGDENRQRDAVEKRADYAAAGIPEYWLIDPEARTITVLTLPHDVNEYELHGEFSSGETATSVLLAGFSVEVSACFAAADAAN